jgi:outer membrane receptor protein involved in Fe transport
MKAYLSGAAIIALAMPATLASANAGSEADSADEIVISARRSTYAEAQVSEEMIMRQSALTSVNAVINELPGVFASEADTFGSVDNSTSITMRGFTVGSGGNHQIGTTIDGMPNGGSAYGGGSKANRYLDVMNLRTVTVSQGTADISSRSNEALGGTLNYQTSDPEKDRRFRFGIAMGDFGAQKIFARVDAGEIAPDTYLWISGSTSKVNDWVSETDKNTRDHLAAKLTSQQGKVKLTGYVSYDDADEGEYGSVSVEQFKSNPDNDGLTSEWSGIPYFDQNYRRGWRALRKNLFAYGKAEADLGEVKLVAGVYGHKMTGRGDWLPPYLVDVRNDAGGPQTEYLGRETLYGGSSIGQFSFVNADGSAATMIVGCTGSAGLAPAADPSCYGPGVAPVMSYRHTHYKNRRMGATLDLVWDRDFGAFENQLRAGLWYENGRSTTTRDWHKLTDARLGFQFDGQPYWVQYSERNKLDELMYYVEDVVTLGDLSLRAGVKQFFLNQRREKILGNVSEAALKSHSKPLISVGANYQVMGELEIFAGFSQNFAAIRQGVLSAAKDSLNIVNPETANNIEVGARYTGSRFNASATLYSIDFSNRIAFIPANLVDGIDYLGQVDGVYLNLGGVKSKGIELAASYRLTRDLKFSTAYSYNSAKYRGTGSVARDEALGIRPGVQVYNSPEHMLVGSFDWADTMFKAGISTKYVSSRFIDTRAIYESGSFVLTNAYLGVNLDEVVPNVKGMDFTITINNLTDERYLAGASGGTAFLGAPRTISAALTLDF